MQSFYVYTVCIGRGPSRMKEELTTKVIITLIIYAEVIAASFPHHKHNTIAVNIISRCYSSKKSLKNEHPKHGVTM